MNKKLSLSQFSYREKTIEQIIKTRDSFDWLGIEIVPEILNWEMDNLNYRQISTFQAQLSKLGIKVSGIQSLLSGMNSTLLLEAHSQELILKRINNISKIAEKLECSKLIFGSPKSRKRLDNTNKNTKNILKDFFSKISEILVPYDIILCIEPNSKVYGAEFFTTYPEVQQFVKALDAPNIKAMLDTANSRLENLNEAKLIKSEAPYHVHISGKFFEEPEPDIQHVNFISQLDSLGYTDWITFEFNGKDNLASFSNKWFGILND